MATTLARINSVMDEIDQLQGVLAEDIAGLSQLQPALSSDAIKTKKLAAKSLQSTRQQLEALKTGDQRWVQQVTSTENS